MKEKTNKKIFIHIGLHKTGTKYYQHFVFPKLNKKKFLYNPPTLDQYLMDYLQADKEDKKKILKTILEEKNRLIKNNSDKKILISREIMSGNLFSAYDKWDESTQAIKDLFPEAYIIVALRFQPDWLLSCYRESLHEHHYQHINKFLCFNKNNKRFLKPKSNKNKKGYAQLYALNLNYPKMLERLIKLFSKNNVSILFYEDLKKNQEAFTKKMLSIIGSEKVKPKKMKGIPNRGYSSLSIKLSILRAKLLKSIGLRFLVHRPIFFYGEKSIPAGKEEVSLLNKEKYWGQYFKRDNEEVRSLNYPNLTFKEKLKMELSWRAFIKKRLDRLFYIDKDPLRKVRPFLNEEYYKINQGLKRLVPEKEIPEKYLGK